ncbi:MAG: DnaB-like helicase C-terminal domain-containing protein [Oscillospiraceae bacterium]
MAGRKTTEGNVIACIYKDPLLLAEAKLHTKDFITEDGAYYFALAQQLVDKGFTSFDEVTMLSNISDNVEVGFEERGGWDTVQNLIDIINEKNWETYIDKLYRENIILGLHRNGFNLLQPINENGKEIAPLSLFRKMDSESVLDWYESRLSTFGTGYSSRVLEEEDIDFDDQFLDDCVAGLENGVPFDCSGEDINGDSMSCFPFLSRQIGGLLDGTLNMLGGYSSTGKSTAWITIIMGLLHRGRKALIISNEQKCKVFKMNFIIWILYKHFRYYNLTKTKMKNGTINDEDKKMYKVAQQYWRDNYKGKVKFIAIPDANMALVKKKIRENVLKYGYDTVLYDTFKLDFDQSSDSKEYLSLIKDSRELDKMAKKYNVIMLASIQLTINTLGKLFLDASVLSGSKAIKEILETLLLMRKVYPEELDPSNKKLFCRPFQQKNINGKWVEQEYEPNVNQPHRMLFVDKARNGQSSDDNGVAYLLQFDGAHGIFKEVAQCRPKHGYIT